MSARQVHLKTSFMGVNILLSNLNHCYCNLNDCCKNEHCLLCKYVRSIYLLTK